MSLRFVIVLVLGTFASLFFALHQNHLNAELGGSSQGTQGTNYTMAYGFTQNGLHFFTPETQLLNYRGANYHLSTTNDTTGITAAHFPIHAFIPASICIAIGTPLLTTFRSYTILYGFVGLLFTFLLSLRITKHIGKSLFVMVFIGTAPVFSYYQNNVIPEIPSLANFSVGLYFLYRFFESDKIRYAWIGLLFLLLAALSTTFFFYGLVAAIVLVLYTLHRMQKLTKQHFVIAFVYLVPLILSELHFYWIKRDYGTQFPDFLEIWDPEQLIVSDLFHSFKLHYFTVFQFVLLILLTVVWFFQRKVRTHHCSLNSSLKKTGILPFVLFGGAIIGYPIQLFTNDVFFLVAVIPVLTLLLILLVSSINTSLLDKFPRIGYSLFLVLLLVLISEGNWTQMVRHEHIRTSEGNRIVFGYKGSHILLKENDIPQNERIGALIPPNSGLSQQIFNNIGRKGYAIPFPSRVSLNEHSIILAHTWQVEAYKMFLMDYDIIAGNGTVTVMRRKIN